MSQDSSSSGLQQRQSPNFTLPLQALSTRWGFLCSLQISGAAVGSLLHSAHNRSHNTKKKTAPSMRRSQRERGKRREVFVLGNLGGGQSGAGEGWGCPWGAQGPCTGRDGVTAGVSLLWGQSLSQDVTGCPSTERTALPVWGQTQIGQSGLWGFGCSPLCEEQRFFPPECLPGP